MYVMVDIEANGPIPGDYSMFWFGAVIVEPGLKDTFEGKLHPLRGAKIEWTQDAGTGQSACIGYKLANVTEVAVMDWPDPSETMKNFAEWIFSHQSERRVDLPRGRARPMLVSDNNGYDAMWISWYFHHFLGSNPFGHSSTNLGSLYKGLVKDTFKNFKHLRKTIHDHNPVNDAKGNAEAMLAMQEMGLALGF